MMAALALISQLRSPASDFFQFWYAGHLVAIGRSPYDPAAWGIASELYGTRAGLVAVNCVVPDAPACLWAYPPWTAWLFAPFGFLDPDSGIALQGAFLLVVGAVGAVFLARAVPLSRPAAMVVRFVTVASAPFVWSSFLGHFEGLLLLGAVVLVHAIRDRRALPLAASALVLSLKPNLFVALVPLTIALLVGRRSWRSIAVATVTVLIVCVAGLVFEPRWLASLSLVTTKVTLTAPTTWSMAAHLTPSFAPVTIALVLAVSAGSAWSSFRAAPRVLRDTTFVAAAIALSLALTPYAHLYDYLLLAPAIAVAIAALEPRGGVARAFALVAFGGGFILVTWIAFLSGPHGDEQAANALIPPAALAGMALALRLAARGSAGGRRAAIRPVTSRHDPKSL